MHKVGNCACKILIQSSGATNSRHVFYGLVLIITLINKLLNLPIVKSDQSSHLDQSPQLCCLTAAHLCSQVDAEM